MEIELIQRELGPIERLTFRAAYVALSVAMRAARAFSGYCQTFGDIAVSRASARDYRPSEAPRTVH